MSEQLLTRLLCSRGGRNFGMQEWHDYIDPEEPWRPTCESWVIRDPGAVDPLVLQSSDFAAALARQDS